MLVWIFGIFKVFGFVSIERQIKDGPGGLFLQDEYFISYVSIYAVPNFNSV